MSEPARRATRVEEIAPGLLHWTVDDDRIGTRSDAYALALADGTVAIDPLPLSERAARRLGTIAAVVISGARAIASALARALAR